MGEVSLENAEAEKGEIKVLKNKQLSRIICKSAFGIVLFLVLSEDAMKQLCYITFPEILSFVKSENVKIPFNCR